MTNDVFIADISPPQLARLEAIVARAPSSIGSDRCALIPYKRPSFLVTIEGKRRKIAVPRVIALLRYGYVAAAQKVTQTCGNPGCITHLKIESPTFPEPTPEKHVYRPALTKQERQEVWMRLKDGEPRKSIATAMNASVATIHRISKKGP